MGVPAALRATGSQTFSSLVVFGTVSLSLLTAVASFISMISWWVNCWFREHKARRRPYIEPFSGSITIRNFVGHVMIMNVIGMISAFVFAVLYIMKGFPYPTLLLALLQGLLAITICVISFINRKWFFIVAYVTHTTAIMGLTIAVLIEIIQTYRKVCIPGTCEWYYSTLIFLYSTTWHGLLLIKTGEYWCFVSPALQNLNSLG
ncbi:hypothetical protein FKM82_031275 [Ascaphus truei]